MTTWNTRTLKEWLLEHFAINISGEMLRRALKRLGWSFKKARKILAKASTEKRNEYLEETLIPYLKECEEGRRTLIFVDEAHVHQDCDLGYGWAPSSERLYAPTISPGLYSKKTFYGFYVLNNHQVHIWPAERANKEITNEMLERLNQDELGPKPTVIWDGAPAHRAILVREKAEELGLEIVRLPGYSPDLMPVEHLWKWLREEVTYNDCPLTLDELLERVEDFEAKLQDQPQAVARCLHIRTQLNSTEEELRFSK